MTTVWIKTWEVRGTSDKVWVVGQKRDGSWGCSCPAWIFQKGERRDCQHILRIKLETIHLQQQPEPKATEKPKPVEIKPLTKPVRRIRK